MSKTYAEMLSRVAYIPSSVCTTMRQSVLTILRVRTFLVRLFACLQVATLQALLVALDSLRRAEAARGAECTTVFCLSHAWDETKQMLREPRATPLARQGTQKVARTILVQRARVLLSATIRTEGGQVTEHVRTEMQVIPPLELMGKTVPFLASGLGRGLAAPVFDKAGMHKLGGLVSATVLSMVGDAASTNRRFLKHLVGQALADEWPESVILDVAHVCFLHQVHRIKVQLVDIHRTVSIMYCMSKLVRAGSILHVVADHIGRIAGACKRVRGPPPAEAVEKAAAAKRALDTIFRPDAPHHLRPTKSGEPKQSQLASDIGKLMFMANGGFPSDPTAPLVHYCTDGQGGVCCQNQAESQDKMVSAFLNVFVAHSLPTATLSRWTHVQVVAGMLCAGFICQDVWTRALLRGLEVAEGAEATAAQRLALVAAGAGDEDLAVQHRARVAKVRGWLAEQSTRMQIGCMYLMLRVLDSVSYVLMTGAHHDEGPSLHSQRSPPAALPVRDLHACVRDALAALGRHLREFTNEDAESATFLKSLGVTPEDLSSDACMRTFRRAVVGASVGLCRRVGLRLQSFPLRLWLVVEPGVPEEVRRQCADDLYNLPGCCVGTFCTGLRRLCGSSERLLSDFGCAIIRSWLGNQTWGVHECEKEHASCRRLCTGSGPGRNWDLVSRERFMEIVRSGHSQRCGADPAITSVASRGSKRGAPDSAASGDHAHNPLFALCVEPPPELPSWAALTTRGGGIADEVALQAIADAHAPQVAEAPLGGRPRGAIGAAALQVSVVLG